MSEFNSEHAGYRWEMTFLNSDPKIAEFPAEPGWELCTDKAFAAQTPEAFAQWEECVENVSKTQTPAAEKQIDFGSELSDPEADKQMEPIGEPSEQGIVAAMQANRPKRRARREKTHYEDMSPFRKAAHVTAIGAAITSMAAPCSGDVSSPQLYSPPSVQYTDPKADTCPPGTTIGAFNVNGFGNNMIGVYSARQEQRFLPEQKDICFAGLVFGTDLDAPGNASVLHNYIEKNGLKKVIIFAFSLGGIATIDMLNEYHKQHPDSSVDFSVVFVSAPAEYNDLWDDQKSAVRAFSVGSLDTESVKLITYLSIVGQGDKNPISKQVTEDTNTAAANTPPRLLWEEALRILLGMSKSDMNVAAFGVYDNNDRVVKMPQAIQSTIDRSGLSFLQIISMQHTDHRMNNHAAAWWPANNDDYRGPFTTVIEASREEFRRRENVRILAQCAVRGKVLARVAC